MRWPWVKLHYEGAQARNLAEQHYEETKARGPEVRRVAESLREIRQANHFAEMWRRAAERH
jgi:hypothetical protein